MIKKGKIKGHQESGLVKRESYQDGYSNYIKWTPPCFDGFHGFWVSIEKNTR